MADFDWPASLPEPLDGSFSEARIPNYVSDAAETGAPRRRARFTRQLKKISAKYLLTTDQKNVLLAFYDGSLVGGVHEFNWTHPDTAVVMEMRFVVNDGLQLSHRTVGLWDVSVSLEQI